MNDDIIVASKSPGIAIMMGVHSTDYWTGTCLLSLAAGGTSEKSVSTDWPVMSRYVWYVRERSVKGMSSTAWPIIVKRNGIVLSVPSPTESVPSNVSVMMALGIVEKSKEKSSVCPKMSAMETVTLCSL